MKQRKSQKNNMSLTLDQIGEVGLKYRLVLHDSAVGKDILLWQFDSIVRADKAFDKLKNLIEELYEV